MTPPVKVAVEDANGNVETSDNATQVSLAIATNPAGGTLSGGSAVTVASGIATFPGLSIDTAGSGYTLKASSTPSYTTATSAAFNVTGGIGAPFKLAFVQGPSVAAVGATMTPPVKVAVEDANGNVETSDNATQVSLAIATNPAGGTLSGGSAVTVASGIATFPGLSIDTAGSGYTLKASSNPSYTTATSAAFDITNGTPQAWTTYLGGNDRSDFTSDSGFNPTSVQNLQLAWQASDTAPNHGVFSQPVVSNGLVYWGSNDGYERATDTSGNLVWQTNLGRTTPPACSDPADFGISSTPTITTDVPVGGATSVLFVGGGNSKLYALNAATGAVLWSYDVGGNPNTFIWDSPLVYGNSVYIGVSSFGDCPLTQGQVLKLDRVTGALQNTFNVVPNGCTGGGVWSSPTLDAAAGTIYFTTGTPSPDCPKTPGGPSMYELRTSDLSLVGSWTIPVAQQTIDADFGATPTLFNGVIGGQSVSLVGAIDKNGVFYAFKRDALSSGPVWQTRIAAGGADPNTGNGPIGPAAFDGTTLYVGGDNSSGCSGTVNALNPSSGAFIWKHCFTDGGFVEGAPTVTSGGVVAVGEGSNIAVVSAATGASLFTYAGVGPFFGPSSVVGGTLYEGDMSGNLYALTTGGQAAGPHFVQVNSATPQTNQSTVNVPYVQDQGSGRPQRGGRRLQRCHVDDHLGDRQCGERVPTCSSVDQRVGIEPGDLLRQEHQGSDWGRQHRQGSVLGCGSVCGHSRRGILRPRSREPTRHQCVRRRNRGRRKQRQPHNDRSERNDFRSRHHVGSVRGRYQRFHFADHHLHRRGHCRRPVPEHGWHLAGDREPDGPCGVGHAGRGVPRRMTHRRNGSMQRLLAGLALEGEDNH